MRTLPTLNVRQNVKTCRLEATVMVGRRIYRKVVTPLELIVMCDKRVRTLKAA